MKVRVMAIVMVVMGKTVLTKVTKSDCGGDRNGMIILVMRMMVETVDRGNEDDGVATAESGCNGTVISSPPTKTIGFSP